MARVDYTPRFLTTTYLERGQDNELRLGIHYAGAIVEPDSGTFSLFNRGNVAVVDARVVDIDVDSYAKVDVDASELAAQSLGSNWRVEWHLSMPDDTVHVFRNSAALCRVRLPPASTCGDLLGYHPDLDNYLPTTQTSWQPQLDLAWTRIDSWLQKLGRRPFLIVGVSGLKALHELMGLEIICRLLGGTGDADNKWNRLAETYGAQAKAERDEATFEYDENDGGQAGEKRKAAATSIWLGGAPSARGALWPR